MSLNRRGVTTIDKTAISLDKTTVQKIIKDIHRALTKYGIKEAV